MSPDDARAVVDTSESTLAEGKAGAASPSDTIGRYLVLGALGAGGMGVVLAAYDPELDRKVALKLLRPRLDGGPDAARRARLLREAQALARLSHPNVVAVHDVGTHGETVWIAIEFVRGQTLGAWVRAQPRTWPEVVQALTDAARGVAAAHASGLVHRDLKPDNVMIGNDGRVRVMDFGLAHGRAIATSTHDLSNTREPPSTPEALATATTLATDSAVQPEVAALALQLTQAGAVLGTPSYMSPEQWRGDDVGAAADQFGWSVMAWELLYGERPFAGETVASVSAAILAGRRRPPPPGRRVPTWLRRILERGLAVEPSQRWPSMHALLDALARGRTRMRLQRGALALAGCVALAVGLKGYEQWGVARQVATCEAEGAVIDATWNEHARADIRTAFARTGVTYAEAAAARAFPWFDRQVAAWRVARTDACLNATVRGVWGANTLDRSLWCLEERRTAIEATIAQFARADDVVVRSAVWTAAGLRPLESCVAEEHLLRMPALPLHARSSARAIYGELARVHALRMAEKRDEALRLANRAREHANALQWPPLAAAARYQTGVLLIDDGQFAQAEEVLTRAYLEAASFGTWDLAATAAIELVYTVGYRLDRPDDGRRWAGHAEMALAHAGDPEGLRTARLVTNLGTIARITGDIAGAKALYERALALFEAALGSGHPNIAIALSNLASVDLARGDYAAAGALFERALAIFEAVLAPGDSDIASLLNNLAVLHEHTGRYAEARGLHERALSIREDALGPDHPLVAESLSNLGNVLESLGAYSEARARFERALAIYERQDGPHAVRTARVLLNLGDVLESTGDIAEALTLTRRALALLEAERGPHDPEVASAVSSLANLHLALNAPAEARGPSERAIALFERMYGPDHPQVAQNLVTRARIHLAEREPGPALALLERAVNIYDAHDGLQYGEPSAHFELARALVATGGDRARAIAEATRARDGHREVGAGEAEALAAVETWLAERTRDQQPP